MPDLELLKLGIGVIDNALSIKNPLLILLEIIISVYDKLFGGLITQYLFFVPADFPDLSIILNAAKPIILSAAGSLAFALWLIDLMVQVTEVRQDNSFKRIGMSLLKIAITIFLIVKSYDLVAAIAGIAKAMTGLILEAVLAVNQYVGSPGGYYTENVRAYLDDISLLNGIPVIIVTILAIFVCGISIWTIAKSFLFRFMEIVILYAFAPFLFACAIGEKTSSIAISYTKELSFKYLESVAIMIMMVIASPILRSFIKGMTAVTVGDAQNGTVGAIIGLLSLLLYVGLLAGLISQTEKIFARIR